MCVACVTLHLLHLSNFQRAQTRLWPWRVRCYKTLHKKESLAQWEQGKAAKERKRA